MADWRDEDEERFQDELDEEREQNRRNLSDDFAAFDASRYVRDVRARAAGNIAPQPDAEPEEHDPTADWDDPLSRLPPTIAQRAQPAPNRRAARNMRAGFQSRYQSELSRVRGARPDAQRSAANEREPGLLSGLLGSGLAPGLRWIMIGYGCFGLMLVIGLCGTFAWLFGLISG